jgi:hypothetical protein
MYELKFMEEKDQNKDNEFFNENIKTRKKTGRGLVLFDYESEIEGELNIKEGDILEILESINDGWSLVKLHGKKGLVPSNYINEIYEEVEEKKILLKNNIINKSKEINLISKQIKLKIRLNEFTEYKNNDLFKNCLFRNNIIKEIIQSERRYIISISQLILLYMNSLKLKKDNKKNILEEREFKESNLFFKKSIL